MFRPFAFVGVASAAIIESRPHEHLQMANAQLQNATDAVIKTAAVAGLAYAGAYMAGLEAGMTTSGSSYDSSRKSQESSTGARYCDTKERNPLNFRCTAEYFNGKSTPGPDAAGGVAGTPVGIRNYWCCPAPDLGGEFQGSLDGQCVSSNNGGRNSAQAASVTSAPSECVYHGPCGQQGPAAAGACVGGNDGDIGNSLLGIFGGLGSGQFIPTAGGAAVNTAALSGPTFGSAFWGATPAVHCCLKSEVDGTAVNAGTVLTAFGTDAKDPAILGFWPSFCQETTTCPTGYEDAN